MVKAEFLADACQTREALVMIEISAYVLDPLVNSGWSLVIG